MGSNERPSNGAGRGPIYEGLSTFVDDTDDIHVVVETPRHSGSKFEFDEKLQLFVLKSALPKGLTFPYDFGFLPRTRGEDGDPLDALLLQEEPTFTGCVVVARLLGVIRATQSGNGAPRVRNDRFIAVPRGAPDCASLRSFDELERSLLTQLEAFFVMLGRSQHELVEIEGHEGAATAVQLIRSSLRDAR